MTTNYPQVPWTDEQWALVTQTVQKEASRARVAATFLPLFGPLPPDTDFVRADKLKYKKSPGTDSSEPERMWVDDKRTLPLSTLQVKVWLRGAQMADPNLTSALQMFRRAANVLARLEDAIVFRGQQATDQGPPASAMSGINQIWGVSGGSATRGLLPPSPVLPIGLELVQQVTDRIGLLESKGHLGPFAVVLGEALFADAQKPSPSFVLPSDRIIPFLGGGPLLRSSTLPKNLGVVVTLGGSPIDLVVATDLSVSFLQVTTDPYFVFRVYEKIVLRIKEKGAIELLQIPGAKPTPDANADANANPDANPYDNANPDSNANANPDANANANADAKPTPTVGSDR
jgi:uncharacterized linocin/CFP29 family protein